MAIPPVRLDRIDRAILKHLQVDCLVPVTELSVRVHLSPTACWKRIQRLKAAGVITGQVALCDPAKLGRGTTVFAFIRTRDHSDSWLERFASAIGQLPEIVAAYRLSGDLDYLIQAQVADIEGYDKLYRGLIRLVDLSDISSSFVMERLKYSTAISCDAEGDVDEAWPMGSGIHDAAPSLWTDADGADHEFLLSSLRGAGDA